MMSKRNGATAPSTWSSSHAVTLSRVDAGDIVLGDHPPDGIKPRCSIAWRPWPLCRCDRRDLRGRGRGEVEDGPRGRRPVGAVVRPVPHARADHREGGRRHRRRGRAGQGQRRREPGDQPGVPRAVDPGRVRPARRPGRRRLRRRLPGARGPAVRRRRSCRPPPRARSPSWSPPATRTACARRWRSSRATRTPSSPSASCSSSAVTATRRWPCWSGSPSPSAPARSPPPPVSATPRPTTTTPR